MTFLRLKINHSSPARKNILQDVLTHAQKLAYRSGVAPHRATGFSSLNYLAGSRSVSVMRFFCARKTTQSRIMAGRNGGAFALDGFQIAILLTPLRLATPFSSVLARLLKIYLEAVNMANSAQSQIVFLPYVCAVDPSESMFVQSIRKTEQDLLDRVKAALDEAGVAWIDIRTKERSKPADSDASHIPPMGEVENADNVEDGNDCKYAIRQRLYYGDTLTRTFYNSRVFICKNAAQEYAEQYRHEFKTGQFTTQSEVTELTPQIVNEIRHEYGWNSPTTVYRALPDNWREGCDNA
ncbi:hypothetical protein VJ309_000824 [Salmonella enterica]|uniref:Uncharacterized protein n=1 Tax=Salmonella diarizonae TaxID=59204 RepID=A0A6Y1QVW1_SALDZ|nr:hypothetical protein [Salmonella enterica subsp. diarizonae]EAM7364869.1 hypothetical protein [Salmonella enterica]EBH8033074.1 hypothetical protein [Salmonella bongori]ECP8563395.1 hypothetical protein [Salmonella enterica subsp. enterica serovar Java]EHM1750575.1 hypothetical protein [Salmonella enterica subsp. salamae serovar 40:c:e,n,x,z15]